MKTPKRIEPLIEAELVHEVIRQLKSGKEATVYLVRSEGEVRCAKVYKEASQRSFKKQAHYQEGRRVRNSRRARAMEKGSRYGRREQEEIWQYAEVDALYKLADAGVRVPQPHYFLGGVLLMELITDERGHVASRLGDLDFSPTLAREYHRRLLADVVRMLCTGLVHGDLSEYNVLVSGDGPVIIDLPQAVDAAANNNARTMLERDVANLADFFGRFAPELLNTQYGPEIWQRYESGKLRPDAILSGRVARDHRRADVRGILREIDAARDEALRPHAQFEAPGLD